MRFVVAAGAGISAAVLLFLLMHMLISGEQEFTSDESAGGMVDFIRIREDEITQLKERNRKGEVELPSTVSKPFAEQSSTQ